MQKAFIGPGLEISGGLLGTRYSDLSFDKRGVYWPAEKTLHFTSMALFH
jgi:hypothetical protein